MSNAGGSDGHKQTATSLPPMSTYLPSPSAAASAAVAGTAASDDNDAESARGLLEEDPAALSEVRHTVGVPRNGKWRKMVAYAGPGMLVAVGYVDPGNWATGLGAGSRFGYDLLCIVLLSSLIAIMLQALSLRVGIVCERDLARLCRDRYSKRVATALWLVIEAAIIATDLAEVIGSAIALNLLFGLPLIWGVLVTVADVVLLLLLMRRGWRYIEVFVGALMALIAACFVFEIATADPPVNWADAGMGYAPRGKVLSNGEALYFAVGIMGATVMPHNLYLHSSIIQTRTLLPAPPCDSLPSANPAVSASSAASTDAQLDGQTGSRNGGSVNGAAAPAPAPSASVSAGGIAVASLSNNRNDLGDSPSMSAKREAVTFGTLDSTLSLGLAFLVNSAIVIVAAAVFYSTGETDVAEIQDAYELLTPAMGKAASTVFAVALLAAGQNATLTCTIAGQIVMEGFVRMRLKPWQRRLFSRALAVVPAAIIAVLGGQSGLASLLTLSQVILSLALPFAVFPLIMFAGDRSLMGEFASPPLVRVLSWAAALLITGLNVQLILRLILGVAS